MRIRLLVISLIMLLCVALCGCDMTSTVGANVSTQDHAAGLSQGWVRYDSASDGFSLDVPASWLKLDLTGADIEASIQTLGQANPQLASYLDNSSFRSQISQLASSGIKLMLYDTGANIAALHFATNLNVVRMDVPGGLTLASVVSQNIAEVKSALASGKVSEMLRDETTIDKIPAQRISYSYGMFLPNGSYVDAGLLQYILLDGNTEYVLTFTTTTEEARLRSITFDAIANTFSLTR